MRRLLVLLTVLSALAVFSQETPKKADNEVPVISGDLGSCSADFTVTNSRLKPIYKAKISVLIKYGLGGMHRTTLEIYTNVDGKARVDGLPGKSKRPLSFVVSYEDRATAVVVDTSTKCQGSYPAMVSDKAVAGEF